MSRSSAIRATGRAGQDGVGVRDHCGSPNAGEARTRPTVPSPGHDEPCDGGAKAMKAKCKTGVVHKGGQGGAQGVFEELWVWADPCRHGTELQRGSPVLGFGVLEVLVQAGQGYPCSSDTRRTREGSIPLTPHLNRGDASGDGQPVPVVPWLGDLMALTCSFGPDLHDSVLIRPRLERRAQFWSVLYEKDVARMETVQRKATKTVQGLGGHHVRKG